MSYYNPRKIAQQIEQAIHWDGLLQSSPLEPWLCEPRPVNRHEDRGKHTPKAHTYVSKKSGKSMEAETSLEKAILEALDAMPNVKWFATQCIRFPYKGDEDEYEYTPDVICKMNFGQTLIIEGKPAIDACEWMNYRKYLAGKHLCAKNDWHYVILSPNEGTLEHMASYHVAEIVERHFLKEIDNKPDGRYGGLSMQEYIDFKEKYNINDQTITAIMLKNDLVFHKATPRRYTKLKAGHSWKKVLRKPL